MKTCYADNAEVGGDFTRFQAHLEDILARIPPKGYFLETTNSILVISVQIVTRVQYFFCSIGLKIVTGNWYLGGYIRNVVPQAEWLGEKVHYWEETIKIVAGVARNYPQAAYAGLNNFLQEYFSLVQRATQ